MAKLMGFIKKKQLVYCTVRTKYVTVIQDTGAAKSL
jgi:hypothetical protein